MFKATDCTPKVCKSMEKAELWQSAFTQFKESKSIFILQEPCSIVTHTHTDTHCPMGVQAAPPPLPLQVKRPTQKGHMTQPLAFLSVLLCISGVHETLRHPPLLSLAHARLLVAVAESRACQEPCLGATWNDKMRMRARGWHMVLISSQVYRGSLSTEHNQTYSQHPAHWTSSHTHRFPHDATDPSENEIIFHYFNLSLQKETLKLCILDRVLLGWYKYVFDDFLVNRSFGINENEKQVRRLTLRDLVKGWWISVCTDK